MSVFADMNSKKYLDNVFLDLIVINFKNVIVLKFILIIKKIVRVTKNYLISILMEEVLKNS